MVAEMKTLIFIATLFAIGWGLSELERKRKVGLLLKAIRELKSGMGGHYHWDRDGRHGASCNACNDQWKARERADALVRKASR